MSRLLPLWWHPGMSHDSWTRNYRVRTLSFDQRAITCECANEGMFKNVFAGMTCMCVCVCVYDQWDRWSASVDPECPKSRGRKWERYNYSGIVRCSRSKFLKKYVIEERLYLYLKSMQADFDPSNMVGLMWLELVAYICQAMTRQIEEDLERRGWIHCACIMGTHFTTFVSRKPWMLAHVFIVRMRRGCVPLGTC